MFPVLFRCGLVSQSILKPTKLVYKYMHSYFLSRGVKTMVEYLTCPHYFECYRGTKGRACLILKCLEVKLETWGAWVAFHPLSSREVVCLPMVSVPFTIVCIGIAYVSGENACACHIVNACACHIVNAFNPLLYCFISLTHVALERTAVVR